MGFEPEVPCGSFHTLEIMVFYVIAEELQFLHSVRLEETKSRLLELWSIVSIAGLISLSNCLTMIL